MMRILVVGAGVNGLSSAVCIQEKLPNADITIIAERFPPEDIVSMVAGGVIFGKPAAIQESKMRRALLDTCRYFLDLCKDGNEVIHGAIMKDGAWLIGTETYGETRSDDEKPLSAKVFGKSVRLSAEECRMRMPEKPCSGWEVRSCIVDNRRYLPYLLNKFYSRGGRIKRGRVDNFSEVANDYEVIINCTGLGSRELNDDRDMYAVKGQLIRFNTNEKIDTFVWYLRNPLQPFTEKQDVFYYIPHSRDTVVGGTYEFEVETREVDDETMMRIEKTARKSHPGFKNASIIQKYSGLRPTRKGSFKLERDLIEINGKVLQVIHNYGHGGYGVGMSWGSAIQVTELLEEVYRSKSKL